MRHARLGVILAGLAALGLATWVEGCLFAPEDCGDLLKCAENGGGSASSSGTHGAGGAGGNSTSSGGGTSTSTLASTSTGKITVDCMSDADCKTMDGAVCDLASHTCFSCVDGVQNGPETGKDCGGPCKKCNGEVCPADGSCASNHCDDGLCCDTACLGTCQACNTFGTVGLCTNVPLGSGDPTCADPAQTCDGAGACKKALGTTCTVDNECATSACFAGICRLQTGGNCFTEDVACGSGLCLAGKCADCSSAAQCSSTICNAPTCKAPNGTPCAADTDCSSAACQFGLCLLSNNTSCMKNADCVSGFCDQNSTCQSCVNNGNCSGNATCGTTSFGPNTCLLPSGAYCVTDAQCAGVGKCQGFPAKCK